MGSLGPRTVAGRGREALGVSPRPRPPMRTGGGFLSRSPAPRNESPSGNLCSPVNSSSDPAPGERQGPFRLGRWLLVAGLSAVALLAAWVAVLGPQRAAMEVLLLSSGAQTEYAPGYSGSAFRALQPGATEAEIHAALGLPLEVRQVEPTIEWLYAAAELEQFEADGTNPGISTYSKLTFDARGKLQSAWGMEATGTSSKGMRTTYSMSFGDGQNFLGMTEVDLQALLAAGATQADIEARYGKPAAEYVSKAERWLIYSRSPSSSHYRMRKLALDGSGRLWRKVSDVYWD